LVKLSHVLHRSGIDASSFRRWRPLEAVLATIGSQAEAILDFLEDEVSNGRPKLIDITYLLAEVIPSILILSRVLLPLCRKTLTQNTLEYQFLQGRGFVFASQFAKLLNVQLAGQYLEAAIQVLEAPEAGIPVKVSAVKAIYKYVHLLSQNIARVQSMF
jgi:hypothetical protein